MHSVAWASVWSKISREAWRTCNGKTCNGNKNVTNDRCAEDLILHRSGSMRQSLQFTLVIVAIQDGHPSPTGSIFACHCSFSITLCFIQIPSPRSSPYWWITTALCSVTFFMPNFLSSLVPHGLAFWYYLRISALVLFIDWSASFTIFSSKIITVPGHYIIVLII